MFINLITIICSLILIISNPEKTISTLYNGISVSNSPITIAETSIDQNDPISNVEISSQNEESLLEEKTVTNLEVIDNTKPINKQESTIQIKNIDNIKITNEEEKILKQEKIDNTNIRDQKEKIDTTEDKKLVPIFYDRTTSIYDDDKITLIRIEYYKDNKLLYYSDIEHFNAETNSYIEKIYQYDFDTDIEYLIRTDSYMNGKLINSD